MPGSTFSFFSGIGFLDLGFEHAGFDVAYINEIHKPFLDAYYFARRHMGLPTPYFGSYLGSVTDFLVDSYAMMLQKFMIKARSTTDSIGFIGGPPCPDFSIGGKNRGRDGDNGILSAAYIDLICAQQPDYFLFENVKGLWSTKRHRAFFEELKNQLHNAGFITTEQLLNARWYGAPQDRDRVFLLGFRRGFLRRPELKIANTLPEGCFDWFRYATYSKNEIESCNWPTNDIFCEGAERSLPVNIIEELTVEHWFRRNEVNQHANATHYFRPRAGLKRFQSIPEGDDSRKSFKRLHRWRYSPTVAYGNNEVHLHPYQARRISAAEALALQTLPNTFVLPENMTLSNMFKAIGNGVPFILALAIAQSISDFLVKETLHGAATYGIQPCRSNQPFAAQPELQLRQSAD